jgi:hypothetical protein
MDGVAILRKLGACSDAIEWVQSINDNDRAWNECKRSDWMFWLLNAVRYNHDEPLRRIACECVREVWDHLTPGGRTLIETIEQYCDGRNGWEAVTRARAAAEWAADWAAYWAADSAAEWAADWAACAAARAAACAAACAAADWAARAAARSVAYWAADSVAYLSGAGAGAAARKRQCEIIRKHIPLADILTLVEN